MPHKKNGNNHGLIINANDALPENMTQCCVPNSNCDTGLINLDNLKNVVKVCCNNESCNEGQYMHQACFDAWEESVLSYLRSCGRARSWSEKQRHQNLWTKKGYDLAYKACTCKCGKGHLRKDLDWVVPAVVKYEESKKKKKRNKSNQKPALRATNQPQQVVRTESQPIRTRTNSFGSTGSSSSCSPPSSISPSSPIHQNGKRKDCFFPDVRSRHNSGNGMFPRRTDFSAFNVLPKQKINSFHIKMEDEGCYGNDDTRCFILSAMASARQGRTCCVLCQTSLTIFDHYPLIDGTFFLTPRQLSKNCVQVKLDGRNQYLSAVCMSCLEGWSMQICCRYCSVLWDGSQLILGTMYFYDIFAARPCCGERLKCNSCHQVLVPENQQTFSTYSHSLRCHHCGVTDYHFVKSLSTYQSSLAIH